MTTTEETAAEAAEFDYDMRRARQDAPELDALCRELGFEETGTLAHLEAMDLAGAERLQAMLCEISGVPVPEPEPRPLCDACAAMELSASRADHDCSPQ